MLYVLQVLMTLLGMGLGSALVAGTIIHAPAIFDWIQERIEAIPRAVGLLSGRQRKLRRARIAQAADEARTEAYRAALEEEWDAKGELHDKWMEEYRELTGKPHALFSNLPANFYYERCSTGSDFVVNLCDNPILEMAFATQGEYVCGCQGKKVKPAPGLKQYFRPWNAVELSRPEPLPELVGPTNPFKKKSNQQKLDAITGPIKVGLTKVRVDAETYPGAVVVKEFDERAVAWSADFKKTPRFQKEMDTMEIYERMAKMEREVGEAMKPRAVGELKKSVTIPSTYANYQPQHHGPYHHSTDL